MKLLSWNVAGRTGQLDEQAAAILRQDADVVCLQEVRATTLPRWMEKLEKSGLSEIADSSGRSDHRFFNLTASHWALSELPDLPLPQPERLLSVLIETDYGPVEVHNVHVPPGPGSDLKVRTIEAIHAGLAVAAPRRRILCGDFNTSNRNSLLLRQLEPWDLEDVFLKLNGPDRYVVSSSSPGFERKSGLRLDHTLASESMNPVWCDYQHGWRQNGLSDHSAMETIFEPES